MTESQCVCALLLALDLLVRGCRSNAAPGGAVEASVGVTQGGPQDVGGFRQVAERGQVPKRIRGLA
ncbi:MAG: hypothetical protein OEZ06_31390 [Myxococcales bacterium]|nr:hypothetical protein [Myxococcales bacterium]